MCNVNRASQIDGVIARVAQIREHITQVRQVAAVAEVAGHAGKEEILAEKDRELVHLRRLVAKKDKKIAKLRKVATHGGTDEAASTSAESESQSGTTDERDDSSSQTIGCGDSSSQTTFSPPLTNRDDNASSQATLCLHPAARDVNSCSSQIVLSTLVAAIGLPAAPRESRSASPVRSAVVLLSGKSHMLCSPRQSQERSRHEAMLPLCTSSLRPALSGSVVSRACSPNLPRGGSSLSNGYCQSHLSLRASPMRDVSTLWSSSNGPAPTVQRSSVVLQGVPCSRFRRPSPGLARSPRFSLGKKTTSSYALTRSTPVLIGSTPRGRWPSPTRMGHVVLR